MKSKTLKTAVLSLLLTAPLLAQTASGGADSVLTPEYFDYMGAAFVILMVVIAVAFLIFGTGEGKKTERKPLNIWPKIKSYLVSATPIEREDEILLDHNFDGIKELDNRVPPWFNFLFYGSIVFAVIYMFDYHILQTGQLQEEEYAEEIAIAAAHRAELEKSGALVNEQTVTYLTDPAALSSGEAVYDANCTACHAPQGGGLIGPNLTDEYWIHGGDIKSIYRIVRDGVPSKGMVSWQTQLNPRQMQEVSSFILSLQGTNPPNPKAPEGTKVSSDSIKTAML